MRDDEKHYYFACHELCVKNTLKIILFMYVLEITENNQRI